MRIEPTAKYANQNPETHKHTVHLLRLRKRFQDIYKDDFQDLLFKEAASKDYFFTFLLSYLNLAMILSLTRSANVL